MSNRLGGRSPCMPADLSELLQQNLPLVAALLAGVLVGLNLERFFSDRERQARQTWRKGNSWRWKRERAGANHITPLGTRKPDGAEPKLIDAAEQLRIVMGAQFTIQALLNKSEARVFKELDRMVISRNPGWQVMAQVSLGEILRSKNPEAYSCINSKRVDLLLVDENCQPRHALEYQGRAHHQGAAAARDAIKKEALRRAGIGYHEIVGGYTTPSELRRLVEKLVDNPATMQ